MKILFSGGGTLGPVTPLLALVETLRGADDAADFEFVWIGTERGVELPFVRRAGIPVYTIASGKLRREWNFKNVTDVWHVVRGFFQARALLKELRPDVVMTAGGFVSVPVHYAAWTLGIPSIVHQQDVVIGLANKLMSWVARVITVSIAAHRAKFNQKKVVVTGNPIRPSIRVGSREKGIELFRLRADLATVFVFGGGTGAYAINRVVEDLVRECAGQFQIIHLTGTNRAQPQLTDPLYHPYPFFMGEMAHAYAVADVVVSRAGFNSISEICALGKPAILIPMRGSHQEANAAFVAAAGAAVVIDEMSLSAACLFDAIRDVLGDAARYAEMADKSSALFPMDSNERMVQQLRDLQNLS